MPRASPVKPGIEVRRSSVHGQGVFALRVFAPGETILEYVGEIITLQEALRRHPHNPQDPHHTFYFHIHDDRVIDGLHGGNDSRWINHSCQPNCEPDEVKGRIFIKARRPVFPGEELSFDYDLVSDEPLTDALKAAYACRCGARKCRGTMLSSSFSG
ncbi:SET domain-containing protein-lysine N-methyltransferase [Limnohabitans sp. 2KL-1]|jgi:SET domain-containing protein|uniref:SET domain-containing protein n=1 Tax=Limnohabitans sp. 2KL-1 TaxID=1100699 RepID=UPI000D3336DB|nr:SET domain-containing protein [Limnohabitans sp. 2KL-1]PUE44680.1 SET domain-containing protein-lysine N-methyltransferase [Limnohabitans sp. 2KL-1]